MATTQPGGRIASLDIVRGVGVMGILAMNIVAFAMPFQAYMNPLAYGTEGPADMVVWAASFVLVDGKMRGLFSFLFGASLLLVIERAEAAGESGASVHVRRMLWLLAFGLAHYYFIWFGDILAGYAMIGLVAFLFRRLEPGRLVTWGVLLVVVQFLVFLMLAIGAAFLQSAAATPGAEAETVRQWQDLDRQFGILAGQPLADKLGLFRGAYGPIVEHRLIVNGLAPFTGVLFFGWETLAYMLFGMAALRSGLLRGEWSTFRYRRIALIGLAITLPAYALLALLVARSGFEIPTTLGLVMAATVPLRPVMVVAYAALIILVTAGGGALVDRVAAAGRAAFTNYLGTSLVMTFLFYGYGLGLYGTMRRAELWLFVFAAWAVMLIWSKPWLDRYRYGPFEWLWRSLARGAPQPMRRTAVSG